MRGPWLPCATESHSGAHRPAEATATLQRIAAPLLHRRARCCVRPHRPARPRHGSVYALDVPRAVPEAHLGCSAAGARGHRAWRGACFEVPEGCPNNPVYDGYGFLGLESKTQSKSRSRSRQTRPAAPTCMWRDPLQTLRVELNAHGAGGSCGGGGAPGRQRGCTPGMPCAAQRMAISATGGAALRSRVRRGQAWRLAPVAGEPGGQRLCRAVVGPVLGLHRRSRNLPGAAGERRRRPRAHHPRGAPGPGPGPERPGPAAGAHARACKAALACGCMRVHAAMRRAGQSCRAGTPFAAAPPHTPD